MAMMALLEMMALLAPSGVLPASFVIALIDQATRGTGQRRAMIVLAADVIDRIIEHQHVGPRVVKASDKKRRPPIARWIYARVTGLTSTAMDKVRFAAIWVPGHTTMSKAMKDWEKWLEDVWCPSGPTASPGTTQTEEEQAAGVGTGREQADDLDADDGEDLDAEAERMMEDVARNPPTVAEEAEATADATAESLMRSALSTMQAQYPRWRYFPTRSSRIPTGGAWASRRI